MPRARNAPPDPVRRRAGTLLPVLLPVVLTGLLAGLPPAQSGTAPGALSVDQRTRLIQRLRRLDQPYTDWVLLRDVADKVAAYGVVAQPVIAVEIELARAGTDARYRVRLLGVQARVDPDASVDELRRTAVGDDAELAALAARVLGRIVGPAGGIATLAQDRLAKEARESVRSALVLAAGEAGASDIAPVLKIMLEKGSPATPESLWMAEALAQAADPEFAVTSRAWLVPNSPLVGAGVLLARRRRAVEVEPQLLRLFEADLPQPVATWVIETLGVCGGDAARRSLRESIAAEEDKQRSGQVAVLLDVDARQLALLRLGDREAKAWTEARILRAATMLGSSAPRLPELFGKWRIADAALLLSRWTAREDLPLLARASAARGLCWLRDVRGLDVAATLLGEEHHDVLDPYVVDAMRLLQQTLHEFVADIDRPDYVALLPGDRTGAIDSAKAWRNWLKPRRSAVHWRSPPEDGENLRLWY